MCIRDRGKDVSIAVDSFYNKATAIRVPLRKFSATERCGVELNAHGTFMMDSAAMHAKEFEISTLFSKINLDAMMGMGNITTDPNLPIWVKAQGNIGFADIEQIMPTTKTILRDVPRSNGLQLLADVEGTASRLHVNNVEASLPRYIMLKANGYVLSLIHISTKNWSFSFSASYNFDTHKIAYMNCNISRDLHCFTMTASFVPVGPYKSYNFHISVNSSLLQDLKYDKRSSLSNGVSWY